MADEMSGNRDGFDGNDGDGQGEHRDGDGLGEGQTGGPGDLDWIPARSPGLRENVKQLEELLSLESCSRYTRALFTSAKTVWSAELYEHFVERLVVECSEAFYKARYRYCEHLAEELTWMVRRKVSRNAMPEEVVNNSQSVLAVVETLGVELRGRVR